MRARYPARPPATHRAVEQAAVRSQWQESDVEAHRLELEAGVVGDHVGRPWR